MAFSPLPPEARNWVETTLAQLSLPQLIGQMMVVDFAAVFTHRDHDNFQRMERLIREQHVGALVLAGGGVLDIAVLTNELQRLAALPLLVNADLETGFTFWHPWQRVRGRATDMPELLTGGGTAMPSFMAIGATRSEEYAFHAGHMAAREMRAAGIHWTNSPVMDINNNPRNPIINTRAFGEEPELVSRLGAAYVRGCQSAGVLATLKHFPGQGDTAEDTHMRLPVLNHDLRRLQEVELQPFKAGIAAGAKVVMSAHIALPQLDPELRPATLSSPILTGLLRQQLGFTGLIVTDALTMQGITDQYGPEETALLAVQAGVDLLLVPTDTVAAHARLVRAVASGEIPAEQIRGSVRRILTAKAELGLHRERAVAVDRVMDVVNAPATQQLAEHMAEAALTLLEHRGDILPVQPPQHLLVIIISNSRQPMEGEFLPERLARRGHTVQVMRLSEDNEVPALSRLEESLQRADLALLEICLTVGAWKGATRLPDATSEFLRAARARHKPVIAVSCGDPYVFGYLPPLEASICAYGGGWLMESALARALAGEIPCRGRLPVTIPDRFALGHSAFTRPAGKTA